MSKVGKTRKRSQNYNIFMDNKLLSHESQLQKIKSFITAKLLKDKHSFKVEYNKPIEIKRKSKKVEFKPKVEVKTIDKVEADHYDKSSYDAQKIEKEYLTKVKEPTEDEYDILDEFVSKNDVIIGKLGSGAYGAVFLMKNKQENTIHTLKVMEYDEVEYLRYSWMYKHDISGGQEVLRITKVIDEYYGVDLEFFDGLTLGEKSKMNMSVKDKVKIATAIQQLMIKINSQGVYHRDLHGNNVIIGKDVNIIDFGNCVIKEEPLTWFDKPLASLLCPPIKNPITGKMMNQEKTWYSDEILSEYKQGKFDKVWKKIEPVFEIVDTFGIINNLLLLDNPGIPIQEFRELLKSKEKILNKKFIFYPVYKKFFDTYDV